MRAKLIFSVIRPIVTFAPNPENPAFGTSPVFVMTRDVSLLKGIPAGTKHLYFRDVVVNTVLINNEEFKLTSSPFNEEHHHVVWSELEAKRYEAQGYAVQVDVPPHLKNQVWVFEPKSRAEKRLIERAKMSPEQAYMESAMGIAEEVSAMSDVEIAAYIEENELTDLVAPERIEAIMAQVFGDPKKAAKFILVWDRDRDKNKT